MMNCEEADDDTTVIDDLDICYEGTNTKPESIEVVAKTAAKTTVHQKDSSMKSKKNRLGMITKSIRGIVGQIGKRLSVIRKALWNDMNDRRRFLGFVCHGVLRIKVRSLLSVMDIELHELLYQCPDLTKALAGPTWYSLKYDEEQDYGYSNIIGVESGLSNQLVEWRTLRKEYYTVKRDLSNMTDEWEAACLHPDFLSSDDFQWKERKYWKLLDEAIGLYARTLSAKCHYFQFLTSSEKQNIMYYAHIFFCAFKTGGEWKEPDPKKRELYWLD